MTPYFSCPARIERLQLAAQLWKGTPWRKNSSLRGIGISCHNLPRALYIDAGALSENFPMVDGYTPQAATAYDVMEDFLDARPEFTRIVPQDTVLKPGDLLGLFIPLNNVGGRIRQRCVNHLGVMLAGGWFVHTLMKKNTDFDLIEVHPWSQLLVEAWRPIERI